MHQSETPKPSSDSAVLCARIQMQGVAGTDGGEPVTITTTVIRTQTDSAVGSTVDSTGERKADIDLCTPAHLQRSTTKLRNPVKN